MKSAYAWHLENLRLHRQLEIFIEYNLFFYKNIFYKNTEAEICEILKCT